MLAPARQVVRRPVVQMVRSRHSSLRLPSTTVTATVAPPWSCASEATPTGQPTSHASTSGATRSGTAHGRWAGGGGAVDNPETLVPGSATLPERGPISPGV